MMVHVHGERLGMGVENRRAVGMIGVGTCASTAASTVLDFALIIIVLIVVGVVVDAKLVRFQSGQSNFEATLYKSRNKNLEPFKNFY
jgi:hypothetical protein